MLSPRFSHLIPRKYPFLSHHSQSSLNGGNSRFSGVTIGERRGLKTPQTASKSSLVSIRIAPAILSTISPRTFGPLDGPLDKRLVLSMDEPSRLFTYSVIWSSRSPEECWRK
uniref:Uncharacterized protein n=1 Tax=Arundo donax TaxID=35708 RepID=A0A0A9CRS1_ARUDO